MRHINRPRGFAYRFVTPNINPCQFRPSQKEQTLMLVFDWCRTVSTTQWVTNVSVAHLVTTATRHVAHLMIVDRVPVHLLHLRISMYYDDDNSI